MDARRSSLVILLCIAASGCVTPREKLPDAATNGPSGAGGTAGRAAGTTGSGGTGGLAIGAAGTGGAPSGGSGDTGNVDAASGSDAPAGVQDVASELPPVSCGALTAPPNGMIAVQTMTVGSVATYSCTKGYGPSGSATRSCQQDGTWSGTSPTCVIANCPALRSPTGGMVSAPTLTYGSMATYTCNTGYTLSGAPTSGCQESGAWSTPAPTCTIKDCGALGNPTNGTVNAAVTTFGAVAMYSCNGTFTLVGATTRQCQADGWSGSAPTCACPSPNVVCGSLCINTNTDTNCGGCNKACAPVVCPASTTCRTALQPMLTSNLCNNGVCKTVADCPYYNVPYTPPASGTLCGASADQICDGSGNCVSPTIPCGSGTCAVRPGACCNGVCESSTSGSACSGIGVTNQQCTSTADCGGGRACCAVWGYPGFLNISCVKDTASCVSTQPPSEGSAAVVCATSAECPTGLFCSAASSPMTLVGHKICQ
jgi:hypothetical protein